jgi:hypothetical protein
MARPSARIRTVLNAAPMRKYLSGSAEFTKTFAGSSIPRVTMTKAIRLRRSACPIGFIFGSAAG